MYKLISFRSFSYDTSVITQLALDDPGEEVMADIIPLANGTVHDMDSTGLSTTRPATAITSTLRLKAATLAALVTLYGSLVDERGKSGTLTREGLTGTQETCTARLISVPELGAVSAAAAKYMDVTVVYRPTTKWT